MFVGHTQTDFSVVEVTHSVLCVCSMFGSYIKCIVSKVEAVIELVDEMTNLPKRPWVCDNVSKGVPSLLSKEKHKKDKLFNDLITFFEEHRLTWQDPEVMWKEVYTRFMQSLVVYHVFSGHIDFSANWTLDESPKLPAVSGDEWCNFIDLFFITKYVAYEEIDCINFRKWFLNQIHAGCCSIHNPVHLKRSLSRLMFEIDLLCWLSSGLL